MADIMTYAMRELLKKEEYVYRLSQNAVDHSS
jgi:hypothetical protein